MKLNNKWIISILKVNINRLKVVCTSEGGRKTRDKLLILNTLSSGAKKDHPSSFGKLSTNFERQPILFTVTSGCANTKV